MDNLEQKQQPPSFEQTVEFLKRECFMYAHFVDGVLNGEFQVLQLEQIEKIIDKNFFSFGSMTPLDNEQESLLKHGITERLSYRFNDYKLIDLCGDVYFDGKKLFFGVTDINKPERKNFKKLSPEEKIALFFEPNFWMRMPNTHNADGTGCSISGYGFASWGNRGLLDKGDGYFDTKEEFTAITSAIRTSTGRTKLKVLDIGCGMGKALQDAKEIDSDLETHGITMEQEPGMYKVDNFHYVVAERMPTDFKGKFDLILSNISFRYYLFQHIALRNAVLSLTKGGQARLSVTCDRIPSEPEHNAYFKKLVPEAKDSFGAMKILLEREADKLKRLEKEGKIRLTIYSSKGMGGQGYFIIEKLEEFDEQELAD